MNNATLPDKIELTPITRPPRLSIRPPGSKSLTNRALVIAALAGGSDDRSTISRLTGVLRSEDTEVMINCLHQLGFSIQVDWEKCSLDVHGTDGCIPKSGVDLFVANSGTTMRFLTSMVALGRGHYRLDGIPRMRERPIRDLLSAMHQLGVNVSSENDDGCPPVVVEANGVRGGRASIRGDVSSQFLSGLLMIAPCASGNVTIDVNGVLVSEPYIAMTLAVMREFGASVENSDYRRFHIRSSRGYDAREYAIEPDASAASYFAAAAAVTQGEVTIEGLGKDSLQGDVAFLDVLQSMGCGVNYRQDCTVVKGGKLRGVDVDMNAISDTVMTLAAVACFADGPTTIRNVAHVRHKETDRLAAMSTELRRIGVDVEEFDDGITITPRPMHGAEIETYNDHRIAMSFAVVGLKTPGLVVKNPGCTAKTYPEFFSDWERLQC